MRGRFEIRISVNVFDVDAALARRALDKLSAVFYSKLDDVLWPSPRRERGGTKDDGRL